MRLSEVELSISFAVVDNALEVLASAVSFDGSTSRCSNDVREMKIKMKTAAMTCVGPTRNFRLVWLLIISHAWRWEVEVVGEYLSSSLL